MKGFISKKMLIPYQDPQAMAAAVAASGSILQPQTEPLKPTQPVSARPYADLMDLSSPPRELPPKATPIPLDIDFSHELQEKVGFNDSAGVHWGAATPQHDRLAPDGLPQAEQSPPPAYTEVAQPATQTQQPMVRLLGCSG